MIRCFLYGTVLGIHTCILLILFGAGTSVKRTE